MRGSGVVLWGVLFLGGVAAHGEEAAGRQETPLLDRAFEVARGIEERAGRVEALCEVAGGYALAGRMQKAEEAIEEAKKAGPPILSAGGMGGGPTPGILSGGGLYDQALVAAKGMPEAPARIGFTTYIARKLAEEGKAEKARELLDAATAEAKGLDPSNSVLALKGCGRLYAVMGDTEAANAAFRQALALLGSEEMPGGPEDRVHRAVADYARWCAYEDVRAALETYFDRSHLTELLLELGQTFWDQGQKEAAERALGDALAALPQIQDRDRRLLVQATLAVRNAALGREKDARQALDGVRAALGSVSDQDLKDDLLNAVAACHAELQEFDQALLTARRIGGKYDLSDALVKIAHNLAEAGQSRKAFTVIGRAPTDFVKEKGLAKLAQVFAAAGRYEDGLGAIDRIGRHAYRTTGLVMMAEALRQRGEYRKAVEALSLVPSKGGLKERAASELVELCVETANEGNLSENLSVAMKAIQIMELREARWDSLVLVAQKYEELGQAEDALAVLKLIDAIAPEMAGKYSVVVGLAQWARVCALTGRSEEARELVEEIVAVIEGIDGAEGHLAGALRELVDKGRQFALASALIEGVSSPTLKATGLVHLAGQHAAAGQADAAEATMRKGLQWAEKMESVLRRVKLLVEAAKLCRKWRLEVAEGERRMPGAAAGPAACAA